MRHLSNKVNIVPVIAKADCLTQTEIGALKQKILQEIRDNDIKIYSLPECDRYASPLLRLLNNEPCTKKCACVWGNSCMQPKYERMLNMKFNLSMKFNCMECLSIIWKIFFKKKGNGFLFSLRLFDMIFLWHPISFPFPLLNILRLPKLTLILRSSFCHIFSWFTFSIYDDFCH